MDVQLLPARRLTGGVEATRVSTDTRHVPPFPSSLFGCCLLDVWCDITDFMKLQFDPRMLVIHRFHFFVVWDNLSTYNSYHFAATQALNLKGFNTFSYLTNGRRKAQFA